MVQGIGNGLIKLLLFVVNLLICLCGALIAGFSLWANFDKNFTFHLTNFITQVGVTDASVDSLSKYHSSLWLLMAVGLLLFVVGFLGCCGALCESSILLTLFFLAVLSLIAVETIVVLFATLNRDRFHAVFERALVDGTKTAEQRHQLVPIEKTFECCGGMPDSVAIFRAEHLCDGQLENKIDCYTTIVQLMNETGSVAISLTLALLFVEIMCLLFVCMLCRAFRVNTHQYYYV